MARGRRSGRGTAATGRTDVRRRRTTCRSAPSARGARGRSCGSRRRVVPHARRAWRRQSVRPPRIARSSRSVVRPSRTHAPLARVRSALSVKAAAALPPGRQRCATLELDARAAEERALGAQLRLEEAEAGIADAREGAGRSSPTSDPLSKKHARAPNRCPKVLERHRSSPASGRPMPRAGAQRAESRSRPQARSRSRRCAGANESWPTRLDEVAKRRNEAEVRRAEARARTESLAERAMEEWGLSVDALESMEAFADEEEEEAARGRRRGARQADATDGRHQSARRRGVRRARRARDVPRWNRSRT